MQSETLAKASTYVDDPDFRKVMGCWLGKAVGGTLGMPFEGKDGPLDVKFYDPVPTEMLPNDDLDLQVVWACALADSGATRVGRHLLGKAWRDHVHFPWDEYGVALRNMARGVAPPMSGAFDNWFTRGMGAAIRSELWACLAPGDPELAARYAYEDACVDHAGEGIYSEVFFAALESHAFADSDPDRLLDAAQNVLPVDSEIRTAVQSTRQWWSKLGDWRQVRACILEEYGHENFTDVVMNVAFTVLAWLASEGDFSRAICIATNCGKDTDCTAATVGALMGIIDPDSISEKWLAPIGRELVLSPDIIGLHAPKTLDGFSELVLQLRDQLTDTSVPEAAPEQDTTALGIAAEYADLSAWPKLPGEVAADQWKPITFAGTVGTWPFADFGAEYLALRYSVVLESAESSVVMFNTPQACRVWFDGSLIIQSEGEVMAPSFHRAPEGQLARLSAKPGAHELVAVVRRPANGRDANWVVGIGRDSDKQWLVNAFPSAG